LLEVSDLEGGLWIPGDGVADQRLLCRSLLKEAVALGVTAVEQCSVTEVLQKDGRVVGVNTTSGPTSCVYFVNCAGFWARNVGQLSEPYVKIPLHAVEHYFMYTKKIDGLDPMTPVVRDMDGQVYFREHEGRLMSGGFELEAKPAYEDGVYPCKLQLHLWPVPYILASISI
jgi:pyruvate dehydrogenase phosphatase regulatory subunit